MLVDNVTDYKVEITNYNVVKPFIKKLDKYFYNSKSKSISPGDFFYPL